MYHLLLKWLKTFSDSEESNMAFSSYTLKMRTHLLRESVLLNVCVPQFALSPHIPLFSPSSDFPVTDSDSETGQTNPSGGDGSAASLLMWVACGGVTLLLVVTILLVLLWRRRRRLLLLVPDGQQPASVSLGTLAGAKRDSIGSDYNDSDRSDAVFPLRASDSMICRHYERASGDYGPPVYIVQEITPQSPTNVYYKV